MSFYISGRPTVKGNSASVEYPADVRIECINLRLQHLNCRSKTPGSLILLRPRTNKARLQNDFSNSILGKHIYSPRANFCFSIIWGRSVLDSAGLSSGKD